MATPTRGLQTRLVREFLFGHRATGSKFTQLWEFMSKEHPGLVKSKSHFKNSVLKQMWTRGEVRGPPRLFLMSFRGSSMCGTLWAGAGARGSVCVSYDVEPPLVQRRGAVVGPCFCVCSGDCTCECNVRAWRLLPTD